MLPAVATRFAATKGGTGIETALAQLQESLDRVETRQAAALNGLEESFDAKAKRMRSVLAELGIDAGKMPSAPASAAVGGPFVPVATAACSNASFSASISPAIRSTISAARS